MRKPAGRPRRMTQTAGPGGHIVVLKADPAPENPSKRSHGSAVMHLTPELDVPRGGLYRIGAGPVSGPAAHRQRSAVHRRRETVDLTE